MEDDERVMFTVPHYEQDERELRIYVVTGEAEL